MTPITCSPVPVVVGYERWLSGPTKKYDKAGITVLPIPGDELGRGRGGALLHELSLERDGVGRRYGNKRTLVVALGGNALLKRGDRWRLIFSVKISELAARDHRPACAAMAREVLECTATAGRTAGATK